MQLINELETKYKGEIDAKHQTIITLENSL
jgi:hypothetical protein